MKMLPKNSVATRLTVKKKKKKYLTSYWRRQAKLAQIWEEFKHISNFGLSKYIATILNDHQ